jgi:putative oxidoreductase
MNTQRSTKVCSGAIPTLLTTVVGLLSRIPDTLIALVGRFSVAAVFWLSGQTKIQNFAVNIVSGEFTLGWPRLSSTCFRC